MAVSFENRKIDQIASIQRSAADLHRAERGLHRAGPVAFKIVERYPVFLPDRIISCCVKGPPRPVSHPRTFYDANLPHTMIPKIFDRTRQHTAMGSGPAVRAGGNHQIRLQRNISSSRNLLSHTGPFHERIGHPVRIKSKYFIDFAHKRFLSSKFSLPFLARTAGICLEILPHRNGLLSFLSYNGPAKISRKSISEHLLAGTAFALQITSRRPEIAQSGLISPEDFSLNKSKT